MNAINIQWFDNSALVFSCLSKMIADGWVPSNKHRGVVHGGYVVRPIRKPGEDGFTGIALFNIDEEETTNE